MNYSRNRKPAKEKLEPPAERVYFDTKYGPVSIHQGGAFAKELAVTESNANLQSVENIRVSLHLERFEGLVPFSEELECVANFPELGLQVKHQVLCQMRVGQTHGAAAFQTTYVCVDMTSASQSVVEFEFFQGEKSLIKTALPLRRS